MKVALLSTAALAALSPGAAFAPSRRPPPARAAARPHSALAAVALPALTNPYKSLPWNVAREEQRVARRLTLANAALFRELGLPEDATYEDVAATTKHLIELTEGLPKNEAIKKKIKIEIARDKIYQIRLNERISGVRAEQEDAARVSKLEDEGLEGLIAMTSDNVDDIVKPKKKFRVPLLSPLFEYFVSIFTPPDDKWRRRQLMIWGISSVMCLVAPPLTESFAAINWLPAGAMMGYRGMPLPDGGGGAGYNPFRGRRNKKHNLQAMAISVVVWSVLKGVSAKAVNNFPALVASRSCDWFKLVIVQAGLMTVVMYTQTYKEGEEGKDLMV